MFPDIVDLVRRRLLARNAIIEGEALAISETTGEFYPFQITVQRKRKNAVEEIAHEFPLALVAFDLFYANGKDYTSAPYRVRRAALQKLIKPDARIRVIERVLAHNVQQMEQFFDEQIGHGLEGIIAKRLDARYEAGARNFNWIKLKRAYRCALNDTIDAVIVGYLRGRGARARLRIGALLVAAYDQRTDTFPTIAKVGSGLSDENWIRLRQLLDEDRVSGKPARLDSRMAPDVWVEPKYVITILADEITRSPIHTCARDTQGRGLALRFPRVSRVHPWRQVARRCYDHS